MDYVIKEMSIDNLDLIAEGGMGKIYRINDEQILKVFNNITLEDLEKQKTSSVEVLKAMDIKTEKQYKKLMTGFVPFLLVLNLGRLGDKAEYMSKSSLFLLLHFFLPVLRLKKRSFIRDLDVLKYEEPLPHQQKESVLANS